MHVCFSLRPSHPRPVLTLPVRINTMLLPQTRLSLPANPHSPVLYVKALGRQEGDVRADRTGPEPRARQGFTSH